MCGCILPDVSAQSCCTRLVVSAPAEHWPDSGCCEGRLRWGSLFKYELLCSLLYLHWFAVTSVSFSVKIFIPLPSKASLFFAPCLYLKPNQPICDAFKDYATYLCD